MGRSKIGVRSDFQPGRMYGIEVQGNNVMVVNLEGRIYAIDGICGHHGGHLWEGKLDGGKVKCPSHGFEYDIRTGKLVGGHTRLFGKARDVEAYPIIFEGDDVLVELP